MSSNNPIKIVSTKTIWLVSSLIGILLLTGLIATTIMLFSTKNDTPDSLSEESNNTTELSETFIKETTFKIAKENNTTTYTIIFPTITDRIEYWIADSIKNTIQSGIATPDTGTPISYSKTDGDINAILNIKLSTADKWETIYPSSTPTENNSDNIEVSDDINEAYFETEWALKEINHWQALEEAVKIGYGLESINELENIEDYMYCGIISTSTVDFGEIAPPKPRHMAGFDMVFQITGPTNNNNYVIEYIICENLEINT